MTTPLVTYAVDGRVGIVTLNRPDKLNAISPELKRALVERFHEADADPATGVVVVRAEGRSFSAGYDISPNPARAARKGNALAWHESLTDDVALEMTPWDMRKPVIASVQGHCLGGGCEMVMMCDITIAADDAALRRAGDPLLQRGPRVDHAVHHRPQALPRAALPRRSDRCADRAGVGDGEPRRAARRPRRRPR